MSLTQIHNCTELITYINDIGFLPLLNMGIEGWSAEQLVDEECQYTQLPDGGWDWPLWKWKGEIIQESGCAYGKFFCKKATFISPQWWPDFCNYRRSIYGPYAEDCIENMILQTLKENKSLTTKELRRLCGFNGAKSRGKFDSYLTRLEMGGYIVTENFIYPHDKHGQSYGWGWSLLTTPEAFLGKDACNIGCPPKESYERIISHLRKILPGNSDKLSRYLLR